MRLRYFAPPHFEPGADEIRAHVHRWMDQYPDGAQGGVTLSDGIEYFFAFDVAVDWVEVFFVPMAEAAACFHEDAGSLLDIWTRQHGSERKH